MLVILRMGWEGNVAHVGEVEGCIQAFSGETLNKTEKK